MTDILRISQPTGTFLVPLLQRAGEPEFCVAVVKFRIKHHGGIGVPGERLDLTEEPLEDAMSRGAMEELGLELRPESFSFFGLRADPARDVRKGVALSKVNHGRALPAALKDVPKDNVWTYHGPDTVMFSHPVILEELGVQITAWDAPPPPTDAKTLVPKDPEEVERVAFIDTRLALPPLPISDDAALLLAWRDFVAGGKRRLPGLIHG